MVAHVVKAQKPAEIRATFLLFGVIKISKVLDEPKDEVVIDSDRLSLSERSLPLACATSVRYIAARGI